MGTGVSIRDTTAVRPVALILLVVSLALGASACVGDEDGIAGGDVTALDVDTEAVAEEVDLERLGQEVDEIERIVRDDVSELSGARSLDDFSGRVETTRSRLEESADDLTELDVSADPELERARDDLESAARDLSAQLEEAEGAVHERDLVRALREVSALADDRERVEDAIADIRRELDERAGE